MYWCNTRNHECKPNLSAVASIARVRSASRQDSRRRGRREEKDGRSAQADGASDQQSIDGHFGDAGAWDCSPSPADLNPSDTEAITNLVAKVSTMDVHSLHVQRVDHVLNA
ncbi:hypothetical protein DVH05_025520 [Phytophthora capsici]|nr:hypothetical protein DVH05_025520 [Phytophthora capsici]